MVQVVYNPSILSQNLVEVTLKQSQLYSSSSQATRGAIKMLRVEQWNKTSKDFIKINDAETFCYEFDNEVECDVVAFVEIPPLTFEVFKY